MSSVDIKIDPKRVVARVDRAWQKALGPLSEEILNDCNQYCKMDTGFLIMSSMLNSVPEEGKLVWRTPYARRQYWEIRTAYKDVNPQASWKWCEVAKQNHLERWKVQAQRLWEMFMG